jgi:uncharacterized membrane protein
MCCAWFPFCLLNMSLFLRFSSAQISSPSLILLLEFSVSTDRSLIFVSAASQLVVSGLIFSAMVVVLVL